MADNKQWPNIINQFQNITPTPARTVAGDLVRFIALGMVVLMFLRLLTWLVG